MKRLSRVLFIFLSIAFSPYLWGENNQQIQQLTLHDLFKLAEERSKSIRAFDIAEQESEQGIKIAKNALLPSIDLSLSMSYLGNGTITDRNFSNWQKADMPHFGNNFAVEASQVVYAGGSIKAGIKLAELQYQQSKLDREVNRQDVTFILIGNYLELCKLKNQEEVFEKNITQTESLLKNIRAKEVEGLVLKNDITRYELQLKTLELSLTQVRNNILIISNHLGTTLGFPEDTQIEVDPKVTDSLPSSINKQNWIDLAMNVSPSLQKARLGIKQSKEQEKIIKAGRLPSVALFASNHFDGPITIEVPAINSNFNYWYVGIGVKYDLASLYKSGKKQKQAKLATLKALELENLLRDQTSIGVNSSYVKFQEAFIVYDTQIKSVELAEQNYSIINKRYLNGLALITDMLDASNSKLGAELQLINAHINIIFNYYSLKKASGNL